MTVYAVTYDYAADSTTARDRVRPAHRQFLQQLCSAGSVLAAGPLPADGDDPDGALIVVDAPSADAVHTVLADDPFRVEGLVARITVREWAPVIGRFAD